MFRKLKKTYFNRIIPWTFLFVTACATTQGSKIASRWQDLERSDVLSCGEWPIRQSEIDVGDMTSSGAGDGGFVATMRLRNGSVLPVLAETKGREKVDFEDLISFPIGRDAHVLAMGAWAHEPIAFVVQNKNDRAWLEIRAMRDNRLVSRMATPLGDEVHAGKLQPSKTGWWLQLNHSENQSSFVHVTPDKTTSWKFLISSFQSSSKLAQMVAGPSGGDAFVVELPKGQDSDQGEFKITMLDPAGKFQDYGKVTLATKGGVESWSAVMLDGSVVLAVVRGDSMVGQASLLILAAGSRGTVSWKKDFPMPDVHLGEPVWLSNGSKAVLGLMRWIDAEGSLGRIKVDRFGAEQLTDVGVFAKGSVLVAGYLDSEGRGLGGVRHRETDLWKYKICKISL
jgi:hypothetical protein